MLELTQPYVDSHAEAVLAEDEAGRVRKLQEIYAGPREPFGGWHGRLCAELREAQPGLLYLIAATRSGLADTTPHALGAA